MKPAPFSYHAPTSVEAAVELGSEHAGSVRMLAGGQSLMPLMNARRVRADHLVDLNGIAALDDVRRENGSIVLGALVRQARALSDLDVVADAPLIGEALPHVANPTVRNRGTVCGSLAFAQPSAEMPTIALAMGGEVIAASAAGDRPILIERFFTGPFKTALHAGEVMTAVRLRRWAPGAGHAFAEVSRLRLPIVCAAAIVELDGDEVSRCAVALGGVAPTPIRARDVEAALLGAAPSAETVRAAGERAKASLAPPADVHGTSAYRRSIAGVLVRRALTIAVERARGAAA